MSYSNLSAALRDLESDQIEIRLDTTGDEDHKVTLSLCNEGLKFVLEQAEEHVNLDGSALQELCPQLKDIDLTDLVLRAVTNGSVELEDILDSIEAEDEDSGVSNPDSVLRSPEIGDKVTSTREVTSVHGYGDQRTVNYRENGKYGSMLLKSWRGYGKTRKVLRK